MVEEGSTCLMIPLIGELWCTVLQGHACVGWHGHAAASVAAVAQWPSPKISSVERDFGRLVEAKKLKL